MSVNALFHARGSKTYHADIVTIQQDLGKLGVVSRIVTALSQHAIYS